MIRRLSKVWRAFRSAVTGKFITRAEAEADPEHSVEERRYK